MRITTVTIAFFLFSTVLATPIFSLHRDVVELSKRMDAEGSTTAGGDKPPSGGRQSTRGNTRGRGKWVSSKRKVGRKSQSISRKRAKCQPADLVSKAEFLDALKRIDWQSKQGTQAFTAYHIKGLVKGCDAVVEIVDMNDFNAKVADIITGEIITETAGLRKVKQLFGWGYRSKPRPLYYVLMRDMGVPLSKTELDPIKDAEFITRKKAEAVKRYEAEFHRKLNDTKGNGNYAYQWYIVDKNASDSYDRYDVNFVNWEDRKNNKFVRAPKLISVPDEKDIFAPTKSPEPFKKGSVTVTSSDSEHVGTSAVNRGDRDQSGRANRMEPSQK